MCTYAWQENFFIKTIKNSYELVWNNDRFDINVRELDINKKAWCIYIHLDLNIWELYMKRKKIDKSNMYLDI